MRALIIEPGPNFSVQDVHVGWTRALMDLGITTVSLNLSDRLDFYSQVAIEKNGEWKQALSGEAAVTIASKGVESVLYEFWPDVVIVTSCFFVPVPVLDLMRARGHKVVLLLTESPYEDDSQIQRAAHADVCLINDPTNIDKFREVCPHTYYTPHSYDPDTHWPRPAKPELKSDVVFVGTGFESRINYLEQVDWSGIDLFLGGNWQRLTEHSQLRPFVAHPIAHCLDNTDAVDAYCSSKTSFNLYRTESERDDLSDGWACGPREIELAATGTWFARQARPESDVLFPMLPTFDTPEELGTILRWALDHDTEREAAAAQARAAIADRTFKNSASQLLKLLA